MTLLSFDVPPRDVTAGALGLLLHAPAPAALAEVRLRATHGGTLRLGVLGASHVVTATVPGHELTEQVSCDALPAGGTALPRHLRSGGFEIRSSVSAVSRAELDATAGDLRARAAEDPAWLCGRFPGSDSALTALTGAALAEGGWAWQTWHLYPAGATGEIVTTRSRWTP
ncbi:DUF2617 family protein [Geodermatophilus sabuli]|uniref:DUF2617 family protein n=1 Tax=Geodermatophilus sabuli TaxID=1564158 RepID=A0A285EKC4_9ACTN|nr:DUF2617 family protein [Geodermatophilus sabuli]MBB3083966.1 hypothetical protein [Geodermatophilus sabuli]SNX98614.1 Protein of unknown function DUF2617 [Geodermatophilus sabuli]